MAFIKADMDLVKQAVPYFKIPQVETLLNSTNKSKSRKETLQRERSIGKQIIKHDMIMFNQC